MTSNTRGAIFSAVLIGLLGSEALWTHLFRIPSLIEEQSKEDNELVEARVDSTVQAQHERLLMEIPKVLAVTNLAQVDSTPEASIERVLRLFEFGERRMEEHKEYKKVVEPFIRSLMAEQQGSPDFSKCAYVLAKNGSPIFWVACDGSKRKIFYGKPNRKLVNDVYYYQGDDGKAVILSALSSVVIR